MASRHFSAPYHRAVASLSGGYPAAFILSPLAILLVGGLMLFFSTGMALPDPQVENPAGLPAAVPVAGMEQFLSPVFTPEVQFWAERIQTWAEQAGLDPNLAATVMQIESCGDPRALSRSGAMGLFQVMPYHFTAADEPYDPDTNALRGLDYLRRSLEAAHGDARLALAGYNGGIGVIGWDESEWSEQTRRYAYFGSGIYAEASSGFSTSAQLQVWFNSYGRSLCAQAAGRLGLNP